MPLTQQRMPAKMRKSPAVAHFEELAQCHGAGLPVAVDDPAGEGHEEAEGGHHCAPELGGEPGLVKLFPHRDDGDGSDARHAGGDGEEVAAGAAVGGEEIGDAAGVASGVEGESRDDCDDGDEDQEVCRVEVREGEEGHQIRVGESG